jgi:hypothetical protein
MSHAMLPSLASVLTSALAIRTGCPWPRNEARLSSSNVRARSMSPCARKASARLQRARAEPKLLPNSRVMASACSFKRTACP